MHKSSIKMRRTDLSHFTNNFLDCYTTVICDYSPNLLNFVSACGWPELQPDLKRLYHFLIWILPKLHWQKTTAGFSRWFELAYDQAFSNILYMCSTRSVILLANNNPTSEHYTYVLWAGQLVTDTAHQCKTFKHAQEACLQLTPQGFRSGDIRFRGENIKFGTIWTHLVNYWRSDRIECVKDREFTFFIIYISLLIYFLYILVLLLFASRRQP